MPNGGRVSIRNTRLSAISWLTAICRRVAGACSEKFVRRKNAGPKTGGLHLVDNQLAENTKLKLGWRSVFVCRLGVRFGQNTRFPLIYGGQEKAVLETRLSVGCGKTRSLGEFGVQGRREGLAM